jgi:hypothetical protein
MTNDRIEQFERDRNAMLNAIGQNGEKEIELEEPEIELEDTSDTYYKEQIAEASESCSSADEFDLRLGQIFEAEVEFNRTIENKTEEEQEVAREKRQKHKDDVKRRVEERGSVNAFGSMIELMNDVHAFFGGGTVFKASVAFVVIPIALYWHIRENLLCGILAFGFMFLACRILLIGVGVVGGCMVQCYAGWIGPRFLCEVKKGSVGVKSTINTANWIVSLTSNFWWMSFGLVFMIGLYLTPWTVRDWITGWLLTLAFSCFASLFCWVIFDFFGFAIYQGIVSSALKNGKSTFSMRFLCDRSRMLYRDIKGKLPSHKQRMKRFSEEYTGVV